MLTQQQLKQLTDTDIEEYLECYRRELELTERRLAALKRRQAIEPSWCHYDPMVGEDVSIDIRIEEQEAVLNEYEIYIELFTAETEHRQGLNQTIRML